MNKPLIIVVDDLEAAYLGLINFLKEKAEKVYQNFEFLYCQSYHDLKEWYSKNRGEFVSLIIQDVDYTHLKDSNKLLKKEDCQLSHLEFFDEIALQGFLIYLKIREELDRIVPVLFVSLRVGLDYTKEFTKFLVYPGYGKCSFIPTEITGEEYYPTIVRNIENMALLPVTKEKKETWKKYHKMVIGNSRSMAYLVKEIERIAISDATCVLLGASGVGKELVANALHRLSYRYDPEVIHKRAPLTVNIYALDFNLIEDELFGHEKGAFTGAISAREGIFEAANNSTIFLDEIGELPNEIQIKLLRALEYKKIKRIGASSEIEVDVRIIAATNRTIEELRKKLRPDFYSRLIQHCIFVPSLKERYQNENLEVIEKDVKELAEFFINEMNQKDSRNLTISPIALKFLTKLVYEYVNGQNDIFESNIRTFRNIVERAYERAVSDGALEIDLGHIISTIGMMRFLQPKEEKKEVVSLEEVFHTLNLEEIEKQVIKEALKKSNGNLSQAARLLGIHRDTLRRKIQEYNL
jgi:transcriptional regulator with PAS, ATPase and Fis domain